MRSLFVPFVLLLSAGLAPAADFAGAGGPIPNPDPGGLDIPIAVSGIARPVKTVRLSITLTHPYVGDLQVSLRSPNNISRLVLFSRVGYKRATQTGVESDIGGTYVFDDAASGDFWTAAATNPIPPGAYRTSTGGRPSLSDIGGCATSLTRAFEGLSGAEVNGNWIVNVTDNVSGDAGTVQSVLLSVDEQPRVFANGFEDGTAPAIAAGSRNCLRSYMDLTGSGLATYAVVRNTGGGPMGEITWYLRENNGSTNGVLSEFKHGLAGDVFLEGDYDGDGIGDATVWRAGTLPAPGRFLIRRSTRPSAPLDIAFGRSGDDVTQSGDYDGDGITDLAVYRGGASPGDPSYTLVRYSSTGELRTVPTGENGAFPSGGSDFDGDGKADMAIQSNAGGDVGRFRLFRIADGVQFGDITYGSPTDVIVTGNHVGDLRADITTTRGVGGNIVWTSRDGTTGIGQPPVNLGKSATDLIIGGDYDGDGRDDYAVWHPDADPALSVFIVRRSLFPALTPLQVVHGKQGDYPPAGSRRH